MSDAPIRSINAPRVAPPAPDLAAALPLRIVGVMLLSTWVGVAGAAVSAARPPAAGVSLPRGFNFAYQSDGARSAAPSQVFDDGRRTYLQFNALDRVPEIWTDDGSGRSGARRVVPHLEPPYVIVDQVLPRMRLVLDGEDTFLVNQGWHAPSRAVVAPKGAPRVWTDTTPFGPGEPPGPVASAREARPSREPRRTPPPVAPKAERPRVALAVSEEDEPLDDVPATPVPEAVDLAQAEQTLADRPILASDQFATSRIEAMRGEALAMIERARAAGDQRLERELRRIFREIADTTARSPQPALAVAPEGSRRTPAPPPTRGPLLALADIRPRNDVPPRDEPELDGSARADRREAAGGAPLGAVAQPIEAAQQATAERSAAPLVFEVRDNQRLSQALAHFLETLGWRLEWESQSDFVVRRGYVVRAASLREVLLEALGEYRLSAVLYSGNLVVAVTGGER